MGAIVLSIVSTPIGNLGDITERAKTTLAQCDAIVCEDTRVTGMLLQLLRLPKKELLPLPRLSLGNRIFQRLKRGDRLALVCDAGTPGISDPGYALVSKARAEGVPIEVIPGPSAFLAALSVSGLPVNRFVYLGFLPFKKGRRSFLDSLRDEDRTVVFYESPHRIGRTLRELGDVLRDQPGRPLVICRELTKMHEETVVTTVGEAEGAIRSMTVKGEFCIVLSPNPTRRAHRRAISP